MGQHVHDLSHREGVKRCEKHARQDHQGVGMSWMTQLRGPSARNICTSSCYHDEKMLRRCGRVLLTDIVLDCQEGQEKIWAGSLVTVELKHQLHSFHSFGWERCGSQSEQAVTPFRFSSTATVLLIRHGNRSVSACVHAPFLKAIDSTLVCASCALSWQKPRVADHEDD